MDNRQRPQHLPHPTAPPLSPHALTYPHRRMARVNCVRTALSPWSVVAEYGRIAVAPPPPPARGDYVGLLPNPTQALPCGPLPRISSSMFETTRQVTPLCFFTLGGVRRLNRSRHVVRKAKSDNNLESAGLTAQQLSELTACCGVACVMVAVVCARPPPDGLTSASSQ